MRTLASPLVRAAGPPHIASRGPSLRRGPAAASPLPEAHGYSLRAFRTMPPLQAPIQCTSFRKKLRRNRLLFNPAHRRRPILDFKAPRLVRSKIAPEAVGELMARSLGEANIHYGINYQSPEGEFGMRNLAMQQHGGTVAEYAWNQTGYPEHTTTTFDTELAAFNQTFNQQIPVRPDQRAKYRDPSLRRFNTPKGVRSKYLEFKSPLDPSREDELGYRIGTRFSKASIPFGILRGGRPRFHLDRMSGKKGKEIDRLLAKQGTYEDAVTSRELRFVHRFWDRRPLTLRDEHGKRRLIRMKDHVLFYKNRRRVNPPWEK